jgi:hypothetical protein
MPMLKKSLGVFVVLLLLAEFFFANAFLSGAFLNSTVYKAVNDNANTADIIVVCTCVFLLTLFTGLFGGLAAIFTISLQLIFKYKKLPDGWLLGYPYYHWLV